MINPIFSITSFEELFGFEDYLKKLNLFKVFEPVLKEFGENAVGAIKFIAWGYGLDSDMLATNGNNWSKVSEEIFLKTNLPEALFPAVALMESPSIQICIQRFLEYQNDEHWTQYITYRDLRFQMLSSSLAGIKKSSGEIDYEQKMNNAIHSNKLLSMMNEAKETFIQNNSKLKASVEAFSKANEKAKVTKGPADYAK